MDANRVIERPKQVGHLIDMRYFLAAAMSLLTALALGQETPSPVEEQTPRFTAASEEVVVHARFTDRFGKVVTDLLIEEIEVYEDGVPQKLKRAFTSMEPFDVALMLDLSASTKNQLEMIRRHSAQFIRQVPESNRMLIVTFDDEVYIDCDWSTDRQHVEEVVLDLRHNEKTNHTRLHEAVTLVAQKKFSRDRLRKAIVLYTDGIDEGSRGFSARDSLDTIVESGILVYTIQYDSREHYRRLYTGGRSMEPDWRPPPTPGVKIGGIIIGGSGRDDERAEVMVKTRYENAKKYLQELAKLGGGRYFEAQRIYDLEAAYMRIVEELSKMHTITYVPERRKPDGMYHTIRVRTTRPGVAVQTFRAGYWAK
jgi:VWFA-related protein